MRVPLGAPVFSDPGVDEDDGPDKPDRWGDDRPPIWERPAGLVPPARTSEASGRGANDTLLLDHRRPASRRPGPGLLSRRTATIVVPAVVLVAVAVLALALLTGHGPKFGPLTANQHRTPNAAAPQLPLAAVTFDTYPGQQQRGVFQTINRVVAAGNTIVTMGSQTSDGVVRQQFLVSTNAGASWQLAPVRAPGGGQGVQAALGHPAALLAGGPGGWAAIGPQAIWTSPTGLTWTLAATHGISPQLPGDSVWVITKTADGFLAAGAGAANGANHGATQAVIWTSRDGVTWQRMTAAQLGLAGPGEAVLNISYATWHGNATVISGTVAPGGQGRHHLRRRVAEHQRRGRVDPGDDPGRPRRRDRDHRPGLRRLWAHRGQARTDRERRRRWCRLLFPERAGLAVLGHHRPGRRVDAWPGEGQ